MLKQDKAATQKATEVIFTGSLSSAYQKLREIITAGKYGRNHISEKSL